MKAGRSGFLAGWLAGWFRGREGCGGFSQGDVLDLAGVWGVSFPKRAHFVIM